MDPEHPPSTERTWFAERQVYVRSGLTSRYVVLSRPLQLGVALGLLAIALWLGLASYAAIANHLDALEQRRELARLEGVNRSLRAAAEAARANEELRLEAGKVPALTTELAVAQQARERALSLVEAISGEAEDLKRELALAQDRIAELSAPAAGALPINADGAGPLAIMAEELRAASAQIETARQERDQAEANRQTHAAEIAVLRSELDDARQEIARLRDARGEASDGRPATP